METGVVVKVGRKALLEVVVDLRPGHEIAVVVVDGAWTSSRGGIDDPYDH